MPLPPYPTPSYLIGANFINDGGEEYVLSCGGYQCLGNGTCLGLTNECFKWHGTSEDWENHSSMARARYSHVLDMLPDYRDNNDEVLYPAVSGYQYESDIYKNGKWETLIELDRRFFSMDCIVFDEDAMVYYTLIQDLRVTNPRTGQTTVLMSEAEIPERLRRPGKCALLTKDGQKGIFTRYGFWLGLNSQQFEKVHEPPYHPWANVPNAMWSFRGRPTIFGNPVCDIEQNCLYNRVIQYVPESDEWIQLGTMTRSRTFHVIVEVPISYCDQFAPSDYVPQTTPAPVGTPAPVARTTAAVIIGGFSDTLDPANINNVVEIDGCEGNNYESFAISNYPTRPYLLSADYIEDSEGDYILACGGYNCVNMNECQLSADCYSYDAQSDAWSLHSKMQRTRYAHILRQMPDYAQDESNMVPTVFGYHQEAEAYRNTGGQPIWGDSFTLQGRIFALDCIAYDEDTGDVWSMVGEIYKYNVISGTHETIGPMPAGLERPGKCSLVTINGDKGLFIRYGFFYNINTQLWETKHEPPFHPWAPENNALYTFQVRCSNFVNIINIII